MSKRQIFVKFLNFIFDLKGESSQKLDCKVKLVYLEAIKTQVSALVFI